MSRVTDPRRWVIGPILVSLLVLASPGVARAQQPTLSGTALVGSFTTTGFRCFPTSFGYRSSGNVEPSTSPYYPGTFTQSGGVFTQSGSLAADFVANFVIRTASGTTIEGTARGPLNGGCARGGSTNVFSSGGDNLSATYEATITTADGRRFSDAGAAFASFVGQAPQERDLAGQSRLQFVSQFAAAQPIRAGAHLTLLKAASAGTVPAGSNVDYTYTLVNNGSETPFHVSVQDDGCSPVTYRSGDANNDMLLQPGEEWVFTCSRSYPVAGSYSGEAIGGGTSSETGLPVRSNPSRTTVVVSGGPDQPDVALSKSASPSSGAAPLNVEFTYTLANRGTEILFHVSVTDEGCSPVSYRSGDANGDQLLQPGETWTFTCSRTYEAGGTYSGEAVARGTSSQTGLPVSSNRSGATVAVSRPADVPELELRTGWNARLDLGARPLLVEYTYTLLNHGSETLFHVTVESDGCSPVTYRGGDANADQLLQPGETWTFTCSRSYADSGTYSGEAIARGTSSQTGLPVSSNRSQTTIVVTAPASGV